VPTLKIGPDDAGQRVDRFVRKVLPSATLGHVFKLLRTGRVRVNGAKVKPAVRLQEGDEVLLKLPEEVLSTLTTARKGRRSAPAARSLEAVRIIHRDDDVLAVDKPPMLLCQPADDPEEPSLDQMVLDVVGAGDAHTFRPSLAHRIDRGTSGIVLFGVSGRGLRGLTAAFRERRVTKRYLALVIGAPDRDRFEIDLPLARDQSDERRGKKMKVSRGADAQQAQTEIEVLARRNDGRFTLVEARPRTGRTHQIRAHLRAAKLPIVGDPTYGLPQRNRDFRVSPGIWRQFLHAHRIELDHPCQEGRLAIESPLPEDLVRTLQWAGLALPSSAR
jgi:23S rRNA pseudouridine955/2504/2580 synthase